MRVEIHNKKPLYSGECYKCRTIVRDVKKSEANRWTFFHYLITPSAGFDPWIACPNPKCKAKIYLDCVRWAEEETEQ